VLSSEIYSYQIHVHIASEGYSGRLTSIKSRPVHPAPCTPKAAPVCCFARPAPGRAGAGVRLTARAGRRRSAFGNVNSDVIHRWAYPFVPDVNLFCDSTFEYIHPFLYKEQNVTLAQTASIGRDVLIGSGTSVGDGAVVERTTVGRNCAIGAGAVITGSILFAGVKVGAGVVVTDSIVCEDVVLQAGVKVPRNCVLGGGVVIAERVELAAESRVTWAARPVDDGNNEDDDGFGSSDEEVGEEQELESDEKVVGVGGRGRLWAPAEDEKQALRGMLVMSEAVLEDGADGSDDESSDDEGGGGRALTFEEEVHDIVRRGVDEGVKVDNVAMEVNGRKFAHDKTFGDCAAIIVPTMLGTLAPTESRKDAFAAATKLIKDWKPLVQKFARSIVDQKQTIVAIEEFVVREEWKAHKLMMPILKCMYDLDVLEDSAIVNWAADAEERDEQGQALAAECAKLVEYLEEEDEDEDESDDDE
jgi:translation initiation factor eIF-2B subunit epsilon